MLRRIPLLLALATSVVTAADLPAPEPSPGRPAPLVIAHRGDSAHLPEHTLAAYAHAIEHGADYIEPDLVSTRDGVLVARHENGIGATTDVATHPEFAGRRTVRSVDGQMQEDWFVEDFTFAELRRLRTRERLPELRSTAADGLHPVPRLEEIIELVARESAVRGRVIGLIPEIKHSGHFAAIGLAMEERLLGVLGAHPYTRSAPVVIQSFETGNLRALRTRLEGDDDRGNIRLLQLIGAPDAPPPDLAISGGPTYMDMLAAEGLHGIAAYADIVGPHLAYVLPLDDEGRPLEATPLVAAAQAAGLQVMPYTFRPENHFLPRTLQDGDDPRQRSEAGAIAHIRLLLDAGIDGFFTDDAAIGRAAVDGWSGAD